MFGLDPLVLALFAALLAALEVGLFWAAASLGEAPALRLSKLILVGLATAAAWSAIIGVVVWQSGLNSAALAPEKRLVTLLVAGVCLAAMWAVPALLYAPLVPVPPVKSMRISVYQLLLRGFAYSLLAGVGFVGVAVVQIVNGVDVRMTLTP